MEVVEGLRTHSSTVILAQDKSGENDSVVSCGQNEALGLWKFEDHELNVDDIELSGSTQNAIAFHKNKIFIGLSKHEGSNNVLAYYDIELKKIKFLTQFSMEITALDVDCDGKLLIAGTIDFNLKCYTLEGGFDLWRSSELDGQICSIAISLDSQYYAVSTSNGNVFVFDTAEKSREEALKTYTVCDKFTIGRDGSPKLSMSWYGNLLFLPSRGCVKTLKLGTWIEGIEYRSGFDNVFSVVSVNEETVAACSASGQVICWNRVNGSICFNEMIEQVSGDRFVTSMVIRPDDNLLIANNGGSVYNVSWPREENTMSVQDENDDEGDLAKIKSQYNMSHVMETDEPAVIEIPKKQRRKLPKLLHPGRFDAKDGCKCLVWNRYGKIVAVETEDDNCIEVNFNDASVSEDFVEDNLSSNFELGDMNANVVALASRKSSANESVLYVRNVGAWHRDCRIWKKVMREKEIIQEVVVGQDFVAVYTDMRFLRIYSLNGLQRLIISVPNNIHALISGSKQLAVVTVNSFLEDGEREEFQYEVELMDISIFKTNVISRRVKVPLALSYESDLVWISFTNKGHLVTMDNLFMVRILNETHLWVPVFNGAEELNESDDTIWPIYVTETPSPQFRHLYLRHRSIPSLKKTEVTSVSPLRIPILTSENEKESELEAELLLNDFLSNTSRNADADSAKLLKEHSALMIKLFSEALRANNEGKALEMAAVAKQLQTIQILCNFAAKQGRSVLSDKVSEIGKNQPLNAFQENQGTRVSTPGTLNRRVELKRRATLLPDVNKTQESINTSISMSAETSMNIFEDSAAPTPLNPFKRHGQFTKSPEKKKSKDVFGSLLS
ncbi:unnamed protein product [Bursaphelenchus xylophilus]|uniref:(pine wood nematode) hypothetical protein n=1 Tax=Bursaphelenchus xylophilus TaxID=6326 RepID=A0A1I7SMU6_BURXY|nr:unnamed protein product [Bursaphelenchus xylophilus]CAG9130387.1 unnamed protein product [Bursaphelenchus xylophilus]